MTTTTSPLTPFRECPPEVTPEECERIRVDVTALDDLTSGVWKAWDGYVQPQRGHYIEYDMCRGCALGLLTWIMANRSKERIDCVRGGPTGAFRTYVGRLFGRKTARIIECAFERWYRPELRGDREGFMFNEDTTMDYRLRSILSNIILNKGSIDPTTRVEPIA